MSTTVTCSSSYLLRFHVRLISLASKSGRYNAALRLFSGVLSLGACPSSAAVPSAVKACTGLSSFSHGREIHAISVVLGLTSDAVVQSSLVLFYLKCHAPSAAVEVFAGMPSPDVVTMSSIAAVHARRGRVEETLHVLDKMEGLGLAPNLVTWNGIIAGFRHSGEYRQTLHALREMHARGTRPTGTTLSSALPAAGVVAEVATGEQMHGAAVRGGVARDECVRSALVDMYGRCGRVGEMLRVVEEVERVDVGCCNALVSGLSRNSLVDDALLRFNKFKEEGVELNVVSWTSIISCCSQNGKDMAALDLFREMVASGVRPNHMTIPSLLPACANLAALSHGSAAHCFSLRHRLSDDVYISTALLHMYANCGRLSLSRTLFDSIPHPNLPSWNAIIGAYAIHGDACEASSLFRLMLRHGRHTPDSVTFTALLSAHAHGGSPDDACRLFDSMTPDHGLHPRLEHYASLVTILGRAGRLDEAFSIVSDMPFEPDACVWGSLLASCRLEKHVEIAEVAAERLFEIEPENAGNYILLSNFYISRRMWAAGERVRVRMRRMSVKKSPGCSWIELERRVHVLLAGGGTHPEEANIFEKLEKLNLEMRKTGWLPKSELVLQDVEEQEKEGILCGHSEKLAVVLGLLKTRPGTVIRVIKNLRICVDCHTVIKCISALEGREILVRDTQRFHRFKDGICSCSDYW